MLEVSISELVGQTLSKIEGKEGDEELTFYTVDGKVYKQYHDQDCCEPVYIEDVCGDLADLIGSPILRATEDSNSDEHPEPVDGKELPYSDDSFTWTFYNFTTAKGHVTIRWFGTSNGYYSKSVDFVRVK